MFQLREEHMRALRQVAQENFEERGVAYLRRDPPGDAATQSEEQLRLRIRSCVQRGKRYGLVSEQQVMSFVTATYVVGEDFDTSPDCDWAPRVLRDPRTSGDTKATLLIAHAQIQKGAR